MLYSCTHMATMGQRVKGLILVIHCNFVYSDIISMYVTSNEQVWYKQYFQILIILIWSHQRPI